MKILTEEWVEAFGKAINENPDYKKIPVYKKTL